LEIENCKLKMRWWMECNV